MNILIIEDDQSIRENLQDILEAYNYTVQSFADGYQGLKEILENQPDLIICDIMTPHMDGYEVLKALKANELTANIPFIFLTAKVDRKDQRKGMEMGADDYIVKPFTTQELVNAIESRVQKQKLTQNKIQTELSNKLDEFAKINSHEYNTPLNGIIGLSTTLEESIQSLSTTDIVEIAQAIKTSAKRLHKTFKNYILYTLIQKGQFKSQKSIINSNWLQQHTEITLAETALKFKRQADIEFELKLKKDFTVNLGIEDLSYVIEELIWNAFKFSPKNTKVEVVLGSDAKGFEISVGNYCTESSFFDKAEPFKQFDRELNEQQGSGLGLHLCKKIAEIYGWNLSKTQRADMVTISLNVNI